MEKRDEATTIPKNSSIEEENVSKPLIKDASKVGSTGLVLAQKELEPLDLLV